MKAILRFELPEERPEFDCAVRGGAAFAALHAIRNEIFRPIRKHGYPDKGVQDIIDSELEFSALLIDNMERLFNNILERYSIIET